MFDNLRTILAQHTVLSHTNQGITVARVADSVAGLALTKELLYGIIDTKTVLYLSGGSLQVLYETLAKEEQLHPGAIGMVDERYGKKFHTTSNETMLQETGFLRYLHMRNIPFYPVLQDLSRRETAQVYDQLFRTLNTQYPKSVGLLGIGPDGHTSSIIPNRPDFTNPWFTEKELLVAEFDDPKSHYKERVGMTFLGLSMLDVLIIPVFGIGKKQALEHMFAEGSEEDIPVRFFKRSDIAKKTLLITDQTV